MFCQNVITKEECYLTWESVYHCLANEYLPNRLRAEFCSLVVGNEFVVNPTVVVVFFQQSHDVCHINVLEKTSSWTVQQAQMCTITVQLDT